MRKYKHLFFDLDHTLWDFETNSKQTLSSLLAKYELDKNLSTEKFISDYWIHNKRLWDAYEKSEIDQKTLRFERFNLSLKDQGLMDSRLAELMSQEYLALLPFRKTLMNGAIEILDYLKPNYILHLITNGFEEIQMLKIRNCAIGR
jgi:putative hydrolase of the HAD superfamily